MSPKDYIDINTNGIYQLGDHLIQPGAFGIRALNHHAVYIGDGTIIHYSNNPGEHKLHGVIRKDTVKYLEKAAAKVGASVKVRVHFNPVRDPVTITQVCLSRLHEDKYDLLFNNCQHFANFCVLGDAFSETLRTRTPERRISGRKSKHKTISVTTASNPIRGGAIKSKKRRKIQRLRSHKCSCNNKKKKQMLKTTTQ